MFSGSILFRKQPTHLLIGQPFHLVGQLGIFIPIFDRLPLDLDQSPTREWRTPRGSREKESGYVRLHLALHWLGSTLRPLLGYGACPVLPSLLPGFAILFHVSIFREGIIVALDRRYGQLKSTSPGRLWLPYFVYTGCRCRRGCWCRRPHMQLYFYLQMMIQECFYIL